MTPMLWKYSLRAIRMRPGRSILTLLSVVIGVAAVVSVSIGTATARRAYQEMFAAVTGRASLEVVAAGGGSFNEDVVEKVARVSGVRVASPIVQRQAILYYGDKRKTPVLVMGVDPKLDQSVRDSKVVRGKLLETQPGIAMEAEFADTLGLRVGQRIKLLTGRLVQRLYVEGLLETRGNVAQRLGGMILMRLEVAQYLFKIPNQIDCIQVVLDEGADLAAVREAIAKQLPTGIEVREPSARSHSMEETLKSTEMGLRLATAFSLLLAAFIILNVFLMNVGERRQQLAVMRAVGATRRQIAGVLVRESLAMGTLGTVLGIVAGLFGARLMTQAIDQVLQVSLPSMILTPLPFVLGAAFGFGLSLLGAAIPAWRASRLTPQEALGTVAPDDMEGVSYTMIVIGALLTLTAGGLLAASMTGGLPTDFGVISGVLLLLGLVFLLPVALEWATKAAVWLLRRVFRVETRLAQRQVLRHRGRSTLTIGVLFLAISTGVGLANAILDNVQDVRDWYRRVVSADFFVRAMMPNMATGLSADLPEELGEKIRSIPGIASIDTGRATKVKVDGQSVTVVARELSDPKHLYMNLEHSDKDEVRQQLFAGQVVVGSVLAQRLGLHAGEMVSLETREGPKKFKIAAVSNEYLAGGMVVFIQREVAKRFLGLGGVDVYIIQAKPGQQAEVGKQLQALADEYGVLLQSLDDIIRLIDRMVNGIEGALWGVLVLGFIVAAFGVVNTLTMNVLEQTRELGLLRIVAMTRGQVRKTILLQAMMIGLIGLVPGALAGVGVAYLMYLGTQPTTGHAIDFIFRPLLLVGSLVAALAIVIVSAWIPAERAARLELGQALHYE